MDIQGLVNHNDFDEKRHGSLTPPDNSGSESARSQFPADAARPYPSQYHLGQFDREQTYSPLHPLHNHFYHNGTPPVKRHFENIAASFPYPNAKRKLADTVDHHHGKPLPACRRA